ncbi:TPA: CadC family transcriptional regulator [Citrobacter freundii]|nr:CadC family transcriptional regulator [Citrobacter freundii]
MAKVFLLNGTVVFWPERNLLHAKSDETKRLTLNTPAARCLSLLIQRQGQVIERDYFFEHVWFINGAQVTNNTFYQNISLLRRAFKELGLNEELIVTVPRVGIRLEPQLQVLEQEMDDLLCGPIISPVSTPEATPKSPRKHTLWWVLAGVLICFLASFATWQTQFDSRLSRYIPLSIGKGCHWYANPDVLKFDQHHQFIHTSALDCQSHPWIYLTMYPHFPRVSALTCRQQYSHWRDNDCITYYYFTESRNVGA